MTVGSSLLQKHEESFVLMKMRAVLVAITLLAAPATCGVNAAVSIFGLAVRASENSVIISNDFDDPGYVLTSEWVRRTSLGCDHTRFEIADAERDGITTRALKFGSRYGDRLSGVYYGSDTSGNIQRDTYVHNKTPIDLTSGVTVVDFDFLTDINWDQGAHFWFATPDGSSNRVMRPLRMAGAEQFLLGEYNPEESQYAMKPAGEWYKMRLIVMPPATPGALPSRVHFYMDGQYQGSYAPSASDTDALFNPADCRFYIRIRPNGNMEALLDNLRVWKASDLSFIEPAVKVDSVRFYDNTSGTEEEITYTGLTTGSIMCKVHLVNPDITDTSVRTITGLYNGNSLVDIVVSLTGDSIIPAGGSKTVTSVLEVAPGDGEDLEDFLIKVFIWKDLSSINPIGKSVKFGVMTDLSQLQQQVAAAPPGSEFIIKDGIYKDVLLSLNGHGAAGQPIIIRAQTPGGAVFTGESSLMFSGAKYIVFKDFYFDRCTPISDNIAEPYSSVLLLIGAQHCEITDNYFYQCGREYTGVLRMHTKSSYNTIRNNVFDGSLSLSIRISGNTGANVNLYNNISYNYFKDILPVSEVIPGATNGLECIQLGTGGARYESYYNTVEYNLFENVTGDGGEIISNKTSDNIYRHNTFLNCNSGLTIRNGNNCLVDSNFFINAARGVRLYGQNHTIRNNYFYGGQDAIKIPASNDDGDNVSGYDRTINTLVANNTIVNAGRSVIIGEGYNESTGFIFKPENTRVLNNYIYSSYGTAVNHAASINTSFENNLLHLTGTAEANYESPGLTEAEVGIVHDSASGIFRPQNAALVVDRGSAVENLTHDIDGQPRTGAPDIGADEISDAPVLRRPLSVHDVGPADKWWMKFI